MRTEYFCGRFAAPGLKTLLFCTAAVAALRAAPAATHDCARITQLVNDVELQPDHRPAHLAAIHEAITEGSTIHTAADSRLELDLSSGNFVRVSSATNIRANNEHRFRLTSGAVLLHVAKDSAATQIVTPLIIASSTGATFVLETYRFPNDWSKDGVSSLASDARFRLSVLEGTVRVSRNDDSDESIVLEAKQALIGTVDKPLGDVVKFEPALWLQTNILITGFAPLKPELLALIGTSSGSAWLTAFLQPGLNAGINPINVGTINPNNLSSGSNEVSPNEERLTICHDGTTLTLPVAAAQAHLRNHPHDYAGACH